MTREAQGTVTPEDILPYRVSAYNQGYPRMNLVVLDACSTGTGTDGRLDNSFATAYLYPINDYVNVDQSLLAWRNDTEQDLTNVFTHYLWASLESGYTANKARDRAVVAKGVTEREELARNFMACFGDYYTTLVGVYTGSNIVSAGQWYLIL